MKTEIDMLHAETIHRDQLHTQKNHRFCLVQTVHWGQLHLLAGLRALVAGNTPMEQCLYLFYLSCFLIFLSIFTDPSTQEMHSYSYPLSLK